MTSGMLSIIKGKARLNSTMLHGWNKKTHMMSPQQTWTHEFLFWTKTGTPPRWLIHSYGNIRTSRPIDPNGVLIYSDHKRLEFLLQWVITWHNLIPPTPLFWVADDKGAKGMSLHRTSLWLHSETIDWLARTSEAFPVELHDSIMPRIEKITKANLKPPRHQDPRSPDGRNALHTQQMNSRNPTLALRKYHLRRLMMPRSQTKTRGTCCCRQAMRTWPRNLTQRTR